MKTNEENGKFTSPAEIRIVRTLPGPIERVWDYLTDPVKRARWFAGGPMDLKVGGKVRLEFRHRDIAPDETPPSEYQKLNDEGHTMGGVVTRCEPPHVLAYTFGDEGDSIATFELTEHGNQVVLVLTHRASGDDLSSMAGFGAGWHSHFAILIALLEGTPTPPFWSTHAKLRIEYEKARVAAQAV